MRTNNYELGCTHLISVIPLPTLVTRPEFGKSYVPFTEWMPREARWNFSIYLWKSPTENFFRFGIPKWAISFKILYICCQNLVNFPLRWSVFSNLSYIFVCQVAVSEHWGQLPATKFRNGITDIKCMHPYCRCKNATTYLVLGNRNLYLFVMLFELTSTNAHAKLQTSAPGLKTRNFKCFLH